MRSYEDLIPDSPEELDLLEQEERCRKVLRTVGKAIFMRLFITAILVFALIRTAVQGWVIGLLILVVLMNLTGILPLLSEWSKQRKRLKEIIAQDEV